MHCQGYPVDDKARSVALSQPDRLDEGFASQYFFHIEACGARRWEKDITAGGVRSNFLECVELRYLHAEFFAKP
jgi:hypothetical protein